MNKDHLFKPGNELARARPSVVKLLDSLGLGHNCKEAFEFARDLMRGAVPSKTEPGSFDRPPLALRWEAAKWLAEKRTGKPQQNVAVEHSEGPNGAIDFSRYTDAELEAIETLHRKGLAPGPDVVDAEIVEVVPSKIEG